MTVQANDTIYVDDPDGKKFYEMKDHDAMCLDVGDLVYLGTRPDNKQRPKLCRVQEVKRKQVRGEGVVRTVVLDNGYQFDPASEKDDNALRSITFWRPRRGF